MENYIKRIKINIPRNIKKIATIDSCVAVTSFFIDDDIFNITVNSVNEETNNGLTRKGVRVCEDFYNDFTELHNPIEVEICKDDTSVLIPIKIIESDSGFTMTTRNREMNINKEVLKEFQFQKIGDLNFLILTFCLKIFSVSNGIKFFCHSSNKKHIRKSFKTIQKLCSKFYKKT